MFRLCIIPGHVQLSAVWHDIPRLFAFVTYNLLAQYAFSYEIPTVKEVVEKFDAAQAKAETIQAPFSLTIKRALLQTPTVTKGTLYLSGSDCVHFAFAPPEDLIIHITPKSLVSYSHSEKKGEMLKIGPIKNANRKFLGLGQQLSFLSDFFKLEVSESREITGTVLVTLKPRSLFLKKRMEMVQIWIETETYLPKRLNWIERGGDTWLLDLGTMQINKPVPTSIINFTVPKETTMRSEFSFFATRKK
ncbi:MAG: outer membrane lipoprotein carrier protein LolA [Holophagales bacterium]|jgi:outer membrane lipoprotein-sorting protein|nr:outer membrane lipoprotein carrier protein LolA [Holophagales bacterium]